MTFGSEGWGQDPEFVNEVYPCKVTMVGVGLVGGAYCVIIGLANHLGGEAKVALSGEEARKLNRMLANSLVDLDRLESYGGEPGDVWRCN